jgi:outer membrane cobalamin receptor
VRALRVDAPRAAVSSPVEVLDADAIRVRRALSLGGLLDGLTGLRVQRYGGPGSLETLSLHGAYASHVVVVADGVRLNSPQHGLTDLSLWPGRGIERVEVARGGHSSLYGADAMGGVVLVETAPALATSAALRLESGSFGMRAADVSAALPLGGGGLRISSGRLSADNDFPFRRFGRVLRRWNGGVEQESVGARGDVPLGRSRWTLTGMGSRRSAGVPGPETGAIPGPTTPRSHQWDEDGFLGLRGQAQIRDANVEASLSGRALFQRYQNPAVNVDSRHRVRSLTATAQASGDVGRTRLVAGAEAEVTALRSTDAAAPQRGHIALYALGRRAWERPLGAPLDAVQGDVALRLDGYSDFGRTWTPRMGVVILRQGARLFANVGRDFRAPTFNALYWRPGGNARLRPERGAHAVAGAGWSSGAVEVEASFLRARFRDQIRWVPGEAGIWSARNLSRAVTTAWDARLAVLKSRWRCTLRASHTDALDKEGDPARNPAYGKQQPFVPRDMASGEVMYLGRRLTAFVQHRWVGEAFTRPDNRDSLPAYAVTDASASLRLRLMRTEYEATGTVENLWARRYMVFPQYPLPGRTLRLALTARL